VNRLHPVDPADSSFAAISQTLRRHKVAVPGNVRAALARRITAMTLDAIESDRGADRLAKAWKATRNANLGDDRLWVVLLRMFRWRLDNATWELKAAMQQEGLAYLRTRMEVDLQLGGRSYHIGRRLVGDDPDSKSGRYLLREAVDLLVGVAGVEDRLPVEVRRAYQGQISSALVMLARRAGPSEVLALLQRADEHSLVAEQCGDRSAEHFAYRAEIGLRRFAVSKDEHHLRDAEAATTGDEAKVNKRLAVAAADVAAEYAFLHEVGHGPITPYLSKAEALYADALAINDRDSVQDGYVLARRGQLRYLEYRAATDDRGRRDAGILELALSDLLDPRAVPHRHDGTAVQALLDRARVKARRDDAVGAGADRELGRLLLPAADWPRHEQHFRVAELEAEMMAAFDRNDLDGVRTSLLKASELPEGSPVPAAAMARVSRPLILRWPADDWRPVVAQVLDRLELDSDHPALTPTARRYVAGHSALLAWFLSRQTEDIPGLRRTVHLYRLSFDATEETPGIDALSNCGAASLVLAKLLMKGDEDDAEEAASLLADGVDWLSRALERAAESLQAVRHEFAPMIVHSKLGESALRLYSITPTAELVDLAIEHLSTARELGQDAPELVGLLADAYYRQGLRKSSEDDLSRSIELKDQVFSAGHEQRENRSVAAAAAFRLFKLTNRPAFLTEATTRALQAAVCDPLWPWAVLQLAELSWSHGSLDAETIQIMEPLQLSGLVLAGKRDELLGHAAELAVATTEFPASILGGQVRLGAHGVRVLNDPHRLLEHALVLKRLSFDEARREYDATRRFGDWISARPSARGWRLPEPLSIQEMGDDGVYVMRRLRGRPIGNVLIDWRTGRGDDPYSIFEEALKFLAAFQAWRAITTDLPCTCGDAERDVLSHQATAACERLGVGAPPALIDVFTSVAADAYPAVAKKDPHPGNWLRTPGGHLVLIDIEAHTVRPLLQEAVILIDDLPLLPLNDDGWARRMSLVRTYLGSLDGFGFPGVPDDLPLAEAYEAFAVLNAVRGLGRLRRADPGVSSFSLQSRQLQRDHYVGLLAYIGDRTDAPDLRAMAAAARQAGTSA
jgi:hypothetical protein